MGAMYEIEQTVIYFPFSDNALAYNCVECGGRCCKGFPFHATATELVQLGKCNPGIEVFARERDGNVELTSLPGGCFFLSEDNLCSVEAKLGKENKPYVCRTFPLNRYHWSGPVLIVSPRSMCPVKLAGGNPSDTVVTHADVLGEMKASWHGISMTRREWVLGRNRRSRDTERPWTRELVQFEMSMLGLVDELSDCDNLELWSWQAAALQGFPDYEPPTEVSRNAKREELLRHAQAGARFLGIELADHLDLYSDRNLRALGSIVRCQLLLEAPWLEHREALDMAAPTLVNLSLLTLQARRLAPRSPTLEATRALIDRMLWPALLLSYLDMLPWLDFAETAGDTIAVPELSALADRAIDAIHANTDDLTLAEILGRIGANDLPKALHVLSELRRYARWLRFGDPS